MFSWLLFLAVYLPFQLALNPASGVDLASVRVFILGLFLFWLASGLRCKKIIVRHSIATASIIIFLCLNVFSFLVARNMDWSLRKLLFLFSIFPLYFVVSAIVDTEEKKERLLKWLVFSAVATALVSLIEFISQFLVGLESVYSFWANYIAVPFLGKSFSEAVLKNPSWLVNISGRTILRATSVFPDPHMLSFYLGMLIPVALGLFLKNKTGKYFFAFVILGMADALTFSRGGYIGILAGLFFLEFFFWQKLEMRYKLVSALLLVLIIGIFLFPGPVSSRFFSSFNAKEGSNQGRLATWRQAIAVIEAHPAIGVGIGNYPLEIKPSANYREPIYAHNTYFDIAAETGISNALVWLALLVWAIISFVKKSKKNIINLVLASGLVVFLAHSLVETAIYSPVVLTLLIIFISLAGSEKKDEKTI